MTPEAGQKGIQMSEINNWDENNATSRLYVDPKEQSDEATYSYLKIEEAVANDGLFTDHSADYVAYSFYVRNGGFEMIHLTYSVSITDVTLNLDEYVRIMIVVGQVGASQEPVQTMYMKPDNTTKYYPPDMPQAKMFLSSEYERDPIISESIEQFQTDVIYKFTIFLWIEGYDTEPDMERGSIKIDMKFAIRNAN